MMYKHNFVACIKVNGRILREVNSTVTIPFGSEYSILLKNMNSVRTQVKISIDDTEATSGWIILPANSNTELERFIQNGNLHEGNRFKFIEKTNQIEQHRGNKAGDGLIRIEFKKEILRPVYRYGNVFSDRRSRRYQDTSLGRRCTDSANREYYKMDLSKLKPSGCFTSTSQFGQNVNFTHTSGPSDSFDSSTTYFAGEGGAAAASVAPESDRGITVPGSISNQQFHLVSDFPCEQSEVITLQLKGQLNNENVSQPIEVDSRIKCSTCGRKNNSDSQFCNRCGTALMLIA